MLFDLRGRGRRRTVRVIYVGLALLMGVGLVGFGVGGGFGGGGILNAASNSEGGQQRELRQPDQEVHQDHPDAAEEHIGVGTPGRSPAARSRR